MDYLQIIGIILLLPLTVVVVSLNAIKTEDRHFRKMKERADKKAKLNR
jgi:hypothetical protein|tara:strand:+ start:1355 stop:1498 length:144 start_codon:yes stop_codon:yes gene_type:complete